MTELNLQTERRVPWLVTMYQTTPRHDQNRTTFNVTFTPEQATKTQMRSRDIVLLYLYSRSQMGWVENVTLRSLYRKERPRSLIQEVGWSKGPVWTVAENFDPIPHCRESSPGLFRSQLVAVLTELRRNQHLTYSHNGLQPVMQQKQKISITNSDEIFNGPFGIYNKLKQIWPKSSHKFYFPKSSYCGNNRLCVQTF